MISPVAFIEKPEPVNAEAGEAEAEPGDPDRRPAREPRARRDNRKHGRPARRLFGIMAYDGPNGSGKTAAMVFDTLPTLDGIEWTCKVKDHHHTRRGIYSGKRRVLANLDLFDTATGELHPLADRLTQWSQLLEAEHCDVLLDEVMGVASARDNGGLPGEIAMLLQKLRHFDITLRYTSPRFAAAHIDLRSVVRAVTSCRGYFPKKSPGMAWAANRVFNWRTFSTEDYEDQAPSRNDRDRTKNRAKIVSWIFGPGSKMFAAYDTLGVVSVLAKAKPSGTCSHCGGRRSIPACRCE